MSDVWTVEVNCDGVTIVGDFPPNSVVSYGSEPWAVIAERVLYAYDLDNSGNPVVGYAILCRLRNGFVAANSDGSVTAPTDPLVGDTPTSEITTYGEYYEWQAEYSFLYTPLPPPYGRSDNPFEWVEIHHVVGGIGFTVNQNELGLKNGLSFLSGGLLKITKDFGAGHFLFLTPLGTLTVPFSWMADQGSDALYNVTVLDTPLAAGGIGHGIAFANGAAVNSETTKWFEFYLRKNGVITAGTALSAADPLSWIPSIEDDWFPVDSSHYITTLSFPYFPVPESNGQEATRYRTKCLSIAGDSQTASQYILAVNFGVPSLTSTRIPEHGAILAAQINSGTPDIIRGRDTYDNGHTWGLGTIFSVPGTRNDSPSLAWTGHKLYAVWHEAITGTVLQSFSDDLATTWSNAVTVLTGTNPKLLIDPQHGTQFYFYLDGSLNLKLLRSGDYAHSFIDATPLLVASGLTAQTIVAEFASDGSLIIGYVVTGVWTQKRSKDYGLTWS